MTATTRQRVLWLLGAALGGVFLVAGLYKIVAPAAFAQEIANYRFLPELAPYLAGVLPGIEIVLGLALIAAPLPWRRAAALAATGVMLAFTVAVMQALARGIDIACGCFGQGSASISGLTVLRNVTLLIAAILVVQPGRAKPAPDRP